MPAGRPKLPVRDRLIEAQADRAERINRLESGELVPSADVKAQWIDIGVEIRTRLLAIPSRVAAAHPGNPALIATLERELHDALNGLADDEI